MNLISHLIVGFFLVILLLVLVVIVGGMVVDWIDKHKPVILGLDPPPNTKSDWESTKDFINSIPEVKK